MAIGFCPEFWPTIYGAHAFMVCCPQVIGLFSVIVVQGNLAEDFPQQYELVPFLSMSGVPFKFFARQRARHFLDLLVLQVKNLNFECRNDNGGGVN